ncbi:hypothetical protein [Nocardia sp. NPDC005366]|uniref:hypothetical protein n=1 Tax=Nocardia sp. NPDC005366 TaxID=3156878 RepID=UPI0033BCED4B
MSDTDERATRAMSGVGDHWLVPGKEMVVAVCGGLSHDGHPMLEAAVELARLHEIRERTPLSEAAGIDRRRLQLVRSIDRWMTLTTPVPYGEVGTYDMTVGQVVDRLAERVTQVCVTLAHAPESVLDSVWVRVHELADTYQDLVDGLRAGTHRVPDAC